MTEATHVTRRLVLPPDLNHLALLGRNDEPLRSLESRYDVRITARGHDITLRGEERQVAEAERVLRDLVQMLRERPSLGAGEIRSALRLTAAEPTADVKGRTPFRITSSRPDARNMPTATRIATM